VILSGASQIVADFSVSLDKLFPSSLLQKTSEAFPIEAKAQFGSLHICAEKTTIPGRIGPLNPTTFNLARRIDIPYEANRYFSQANTTTEKHLELLEQIERLAKKSK
jgi:hypothetical protein